MLARAHEAIYSFERSFEASPYVQTQRDNAFTERAKRLRCGDPIHQLVPTKVKAHGDNRVDGRASR
jgi:hypothetical protein